MLTFIPQGDKIRNQLNNWWPITFLNSIYKFLSAILTKRIETVLDRIIHHDQKGFLNNRFIGENTRLTSDIIRECQIQNVDGLIIMIDFAKGFDSISWEFIQKSLQIFNFGNWVQKWVKCLQKGSFSRGIEASHVSDKIFLS